MKTKYARVNREEMMELETKRLRLRPFTDEDAAALYTIAKDPQVADPAGWLLGLALLRRR
jgi:RimJ/RimL family protein N-acetyltransferase